jgi:hypothetical protein
MTALVLYAVSLAIVGLAVLAARVLGKAPGSTARRAGEDDPLRTTGRLPDAPPASPRTRPHAAVRRFFDRQLPEPTGDDERRAVRRQLVDRLVERTVRRAAIEAVRQNGRRGAANASAPAGAWKQHLLVAALAEMRTLTDGDSGSDDGGGVPAQVA